MRRYFVFCLDSNTFLDPWWNCCIGIYFKDSFLLSLCRICILLRKKSSTGIKPQFFFTANANTIWNPHLPRKTNLLWLLSRKPELSTIKKDIRHTEQGHKSRLWLIGNMVSITKLAAYHCPRRYQVTHIYKKHVFISLWSLMWIWYGICKYKCVVN